MRWIETKRNETIIFIFPLFQRFPIRFGLKCGHNGIFQFFNASDATVPCVDVDEDGGGIGTSGERNSGV